MAEGPVNLNWGQIMKTINDNPLEFFRDGGWTFLGGTGAEGSDKVCDPGIHSNCRRNTEVFYDDYSIAPMNQTPNPNSRRKAKNQLRARVIPMKVNSTTDRMQVRMRAVAQKWTKRARAMIGIVSAFILLDTDGIKSVPSP